jgi:hypothetical protein
VGRDLVTDLRTLSQARIYFGHHSVGDNMLSGLRQLAEQEGSPDIRILEFESGIRLPESFLAHSRVGANGDAPSKLEDFARVLRNQALAGIDLALMKFCYADFEPSTDVIGLHELYRAQLSELEDLFPAVRFLHATVPLKVYSRSPKNRVKRLLRSPVWEDDSNARRHEFNELLRGGLQEDRIVDIARVESTRTDGSQVTFSNRGRRYPAMRPDLSPDGGHLNERGERLLGAEMISKLAGSLR